MLSLIFKELLLTRRQLFLGLAYILLFIFAFQSLKGAMFSAAVVPASYMLLLTSCAYDEKNKGDILLNSLPLSRKMVVLAKYISLILLFLATTLFYYIFYLVINATGISLHAYPITAEGLLGAFFAVALISGIYFPIYFKLGYIKSRMLFFIIFFAAFFGVTTMANYLANQPGEPWVQQILDLLYTQSQPVLIAGITGLGLVIMLVSYGISLHFYFRREF